MTARNNIHKRLPDKDVYKKHPRSYKGVKHFLTITYIDSTIRVSARSTNKDRTRVITGIVMLNEDSMIEYMNFDLEHCKQEYIDKLADWDGVTNLKYWCGVNDIPYWRFKQTTMKRQLIKVVGDIIPKEYFYVRRKKNISTAKKFNPKHFQEHKIYDWGKK